MISLVSQPAHTTALSPHPSPDIRMQRSAIDFTGTNVASSRAYADAVTILRASLVPGCVGTYVRPVAKPQQGGLRASGGCPLVLPPHERLVAVEDDKGAHAAAAAALPFPHPSLTAVADADLRAAVKYAVGHRQDIAEFRSEQMSVVEKVARMLTPINDWLLSMVAGAQHEHLVVGTNLAFLAAWCDAAMWPDVSFVERWLHGFPIVGDIPDSGLFRPQEQPPTQPADTFSRSNNCRWCDEVIRKVAGAANHPSTDDHAVLRAVYEQTRKEARQGYVKGPLTRSELNSKFGKNYYRVMVRFGIEQGADGKRKVRAIDNARTSLTNAVSHTHETIVCITFEIAATVSALVLEECMRLGIDMLEMAIGFEDLTAAYRFLPNSQPHFTVFCVWRFSDGKSVPCPVFYYVPGHNFGMASSVLNFNRFPKLMVAMARSLLALPVSQYFDDYFIMDLRCAGGSGQTGLQQLHLLLNRPLDAGKRQSMASKRVGLGVVIDVAAVRSEWAIVVSTKWHRCLSILTMLRSARDNNYLPNGMAATIYGKLGFVLTAVYGRVGRAAAQPLMQRVWHDHTTDFTPALSHMLAFYEALLPYLPPLTIPIYDDGQAPVVIYTDASFHRDVYGDPVSHMGYQIIDPGDSTRNIEPATLHCDRALYPDELAAFAHDKITLIMQAEIALQSVIRGQGGSQRCESI